MTLKNSNFHYARIEISPNQKSTTKLNFQTLMNLLYIFFNYTTLETFQEMLKIFFKCISIAT